MLVVLKQSHGYSLAETKDAQPLRMHYENGDPERSKCRKIARFHKAEDALRAAEELGIPVVPVFLPDNNHRIIIEENA